VESFKLGHYGIVLLFVSLFIVVIFSSQQQNFKGEAAQTAITPTFGTIGTCPTVVPFTATVSIKENPTISSNPANNYTTMHSNAKFFCINTSYTQKT
jgi:hypothetical protein